MSQYPPPYNSGASAPYPPPGGYYPPPGGYYPPPAPYGYPPPVQQQQQQQQQQVQQEHHVVVVNTSRPEPTIVVGKGSCPSCRAGKLTNSFTCCGILACIFFFPIGIICCCLLKQRKCSNCNAIYA